MTQSQFALNQQQPFYFFSCAFHQSLKNIKFSRKMNILCEIIEKMDFRVFLLTLKKAQNDPKGNFPHPFHFFHTRAISCHNILKFQRKRTTFAYKTIWKIDFRGYQHFVIIKKPQNDPKSVFPTLVPSGTGRWMAQTLRCCGKHCEIRGFLSTGKC